jgi:hypothetical protein
MFRQRKGVRYEYRQQERDRVAGSASLAGKFPGLKSLRVELTYCRPDDVLKRQRMIYEVNLENAKSVFLFTCPNGECIHGDFDLTKQLAEAIEQGQRLVTGEMFCRGWQNLLTKGRAQCQNSLQYKFTLAYASPARRRLETADL